MSGKQTETKSTGKIKSNTAEILKDNTQISTKYSSNEKKKAEKETETLEGAAYMVSFGGMRVQLCDNSTDPNNLPGLYS